MPAISLSDDALALLRFHLSGRSLHLKGPKPEGMPGRTIEETLTAYRELAAAGLMYSVSGFAHGPEAYDRLSDEGWNRREEWLSEPAHLPGSPADARAQRA